MIKQYMKQAWNLMKANPLVSCISIAGVALSIAMIMVVVFQYQVRFIGYPPESNRSRMLLVNGIMAINEEQTNNTGLSFEVMKEIFYPLKPVEKVAAYTFLGNNVVSLPEKKKYKEYAVKATDANFWHIFDFTFIAGKPFDQADFEAGLLKVVLSETTARELFGTNEAIGKTILYNFLEYTVAGVVKDVSSGASFAYSQIWIPFTTVDTIVSGRKPYEGIGGELAVVILAHKKSDFEQIWNDVLNRTAGYNTSKTIFQAGYANMPLKRWHIALNISPWRNSISDFILKTGGLLLFLLLVPALNLMGITQASVQQRTAEIGIRKSFGAQYRQIILQVVSENMLISFIGGAVGLLLSILFLYLDKSSLLQGMLLQWRMLLNPFAFLFAFLFILLLNILSSLLPAIRISRQSIISAMSEN